MKVILTLFLVDLCRHLVGTDGLRDATRLPGDHVGLADRVEQLGLAVVDVTHDRDHRRTRREILFATLVLAELDVEALQQLAVLVLGRDDLDLVVELAGQHLQRVLGHGLGGRHHLAQVEQHLDQRRHVDVDLLRQVGQRGAAGEPDGLPVTLAYADATDLRSLHLVELLTTLTLRLATTTHRPTGATERTLGATTTTTAAATRGRTAGTAATGTTRSATATTTTRSTGTTATAGGCTELARALLGHHRRVRPRHAGHAATATGTGTAGATRTTGATTGRRTGSARTGGVGAAGTRRTRLAHALRRGERVVARTRSTAGATRTGCATGQTAGAARTRPRTGLSRSGSAGSAGGAGPGRRLRTRRTVGTAGLVGATGLLATTLVGTLVRPRTGLARSARDDAGPTALRSPRGRGRTGRGLRRRRRRGLDRRLRGSRGLGCRSGRLRRSGGGRGRSGGSGLRRTRAGGGRTRTGADRAAGRGAAGGAAAGTGGRCAGRLSAARPGRGGTAGPRGARTGVTGLGGMTGGRSPRGRLGRATVRAAELLLETPLDGRLDGGRGRTNELPHVLQRAEDDLAFDSELFRELVDPGLCHCSP